MMKKTRSCTMSRYLLLVFCIIIIACHSGAQKGNDTGEGNEVVQTKYLDFRKNVKLVNEFNISELAARLEYIPLNKSNDALLSKILRLDVNDLFILINDGVGRTYMFNPQGQFIKQLYNLGRGPKEAYGTHFIVDKNNNIYVGKKWSHKLLRFTPQGNLQDEKEYPYFERFFHYFNDCLIFQSLFTPKDYAFYAIKIEDDSLVYKRPFRYNNLPPSMAKFLLVMFILKTTRVRCFLKSWSAIPFMQQKTFLTLRFLMYLILAIRFSPLKNTLVKTRML